MTLCGVVGFVGDLSRKSSYPARSTWLVFGGFLRKHIFSTLCVTVCACAAFRICMSSIFSDLLQTIIYILYFIYSVEST